MRILICLLALFLVACGIYFGVWVMLIGGIVQIIDGAKMNPTNATMIAIGIVKCIFFELPIGLGIFFGYITASAAK